MQAVSKKINPTTTKTPFYQHRGTSQNTQSDPKKRPSCRQSAKSLHPKRDCPERPDSCHVYKI